jgi:hypothetical protein
MASFAPEFEGEMTFASLPDDFVARLRQRVDAGLLCPGIRARADYRVDSSDRDRIRIEAHGFLTEYNIGLNEITVSRSGPNRLRYQVRFWRWTWFAVANSLVPGVIIVLTAACFPETRAAYAVAPGGLPAVVGILGFFSLAWPWVLTAFHRRFARRALQRILRETLAGAPARVA